jgi:zinc/manganese transport system substrate-binding protein
VAPRSLTIPVAMLTGLALLAGCGSGTGSGDAEKLSVVASTNVYGDIARTVGGEDVAVTSILSNPDQDPHSFEASPRTALAISKADLLIENGGGYDDYMDTLRKNSDNKAPVINVVELSGKERNEHVWYDLPTVQKLADKIASKLGEADEKHAADYRARADAMAGEIDGLIAREDTIASKAKGEGIGITEPVPLYLTEACGLVDKTPADFSEAIEEGDDVAAPVLEETLDLYRRKQVSALIYNEQTSGPMTTEVKAAAEKAGVPVVPVTETLPSGKGYVSWMSDNIDAVGAAVTR